MRLLRETMADMAGNSSLQEDGFRDLWRLAKQDIVNGLPCLCGKEEWILNNIETLTFFLMGRA